MKGRHMEAIAHSMEHPVVRTTDSDGVDEIIFCLTCQRAVEAELVQPAEDTSVVDE